MEETDALLALNHYAEIKTREAIALLERCGSALAALEEVGVRSELWKRDRELMERHGVRLVSIFDQGYPEGVRALGDAPLALYIRGECKGPGVGIVGTRQCTLYGREMAEAIARDAAGSGFVVISGLARGIDTAAHVGAMGRTVGVIGSGFAQMYPKENIGLAEKMCVISEYGMDVGPQKHHFPRRNRLVSALSKGVLLAEAPVKSGAMITMEMARDQKKSCFALPGRADVESFRGNHSLIKAGKAILVENWQEMLSILEPGKTSFKPPAEQMDLFGLDSDERALLLHFSAEEIFIEELAAKSSLPIAKLSSLLMGLVLKQVIREFPGKYYKRIHG